MEPYNHQFYTKVSNCCCGSKQLSLARDVDNSFATDDRMNPKLADEYGIIMSTSHHEPMMRAWKEWERAATAKGPGDIPKTRNPPRLLG